MKILPEDSRDYARQVEALPDDMRGELLPRALMSGLHRFGATRNIQDVSSAIHDTCELEFGRLDAETRDGALRRVGDPRHRLHRYRARHR